MSIAALYDLQERLNNCAVAGVNMIGEDFRLHRAIEQFGRAASASPVFQRIAQQLQPLVQPDTANKSAVLMDALALINAVLYTQGATQVSGELQPLRLASSGTTYVASRYSELQALKQALTDKGSGRYEVVRSAFEAKAAALYDFRLQASLIAALGDSYGDMADLAMRILASGDERIIPLLKRDFNPKGKRDMARRVEVIEGIAGESENPFYLSLLEGSSTVVKEAAVYALKHDETNTDLLVQLAETEKGALKTAAYSSLTYMNNDRASALWIKHARTNSAEVESYLQEDTSVEIADVVAEKLRELLFPVLQEKRTDLESKEEESLRIALRMSINKISESLLDVYEKLAEKEKELGKLRDKQSSQLLDFGDGDNNLLEEINMKLVEGMVRGLNAALPPAAERLYQANGQVFLHAGFAADLLGKPAAEVFEAFSPMLGTKAGLETIAACLSQVVYDVESKAYYLYESSYNGSRHLHVGSGRPLFEALDPHWLQLLIEPSVYQASKFKRLSQMMGYVDSAHTSNKAMEKYDVMLMGISNPHHPETAKLLYDYFARASQQLYTDIHLYALHRLGHRQFHDLLLRLVQHSSFSTYQLQQACYDLRLSTEEIVALLQDMIALVEQGKLKNRYYTAARLKAIEERLRSGEEVSYW